LTISLLGTLEQTQWLAPFSYLRNTVLLNYSIVGNLGTDPVVGSILLP
jgi:hypothetical protein